jgi:hypothetical protein
MITSAFWTSKDYNHDEKKIGAIYQKVESPYRVIHGVYFTIDEAKKLIGKKDLYPDITLVLDIDYTLGEATMCSHDHLHGFSLDNKKIDLHHIIRIIEEDKASWFHNQTCVFFLRPYFREFITFCENNFKEVIIWTNGTQMHADNMVELVEKVIGKKWRGFGREYSTEYTKIVTNIGLDPTKTWMVDDDHSHHRRIDSNFTINPDIKFFHTPVFSLNLFRDIHEKIPIWGNDEEVYDDWFLFLIWNWNYMKENSIDIKSFNRNDNMFIY